MPPKVRTVKKCAALFKELDPETAITEHYLRMLIKSGYPVIRAGNRMLLNYDELCAYLARGEPEKAEVPHSGEIRPIDPK
jgi:hypothetical protein